MKYSKFFNVNRVVGFSSFFFLFLDIISHEHPFQKNRTKALGID